jgi:antitoxin PrlF
MSRPAKNGSDHHRYGEVKTRLTIDETGHFAWYYHIVERYYFSESPMATTVTSKGQVTIPKPVRDHLGIGPGSQVAFRRAADGTIVIEKADGTRQPSRFAELVGSAGPGLSTDEIMAMTRGE